MVHLINKGYRNSTTAKTIEIVKWYMRWLKKKGLYDGSAYETFQPKIKGREKREAEIYLTWDELQTLYNAELSSEALCQVRDVFCFCCFTSLRYSDVAKLQRSDVFSDHIVSVTKKTNDPLIIQLNNYSTTILNKYKDKRFKNNRALPVISNQKYNEQIKILAKTVGINAPVRLIYFIGNTRHEDVKPKWQLLTTHAARRTFIVNALALGIPSEVVMKWSGHSHHESMLPYIAIVEKLKVEEMKRFNK
ncbi:MAG: site-specific integrase [Paludibacteraceae bacterium]|nr:site-specific integrase [Paludibacteraceae bacterium]